MPLVMLTMRPGHGAIEIAEHGLPHQAGVQRRHAVDLVRADEGQMPHAHALVLAFLNERDRGQHRPGRSKPLATASSRCSLLIT